MDRLSTPSSATTLTFGSIALTRKLDCSPDAALRRGRGRSATTEVMQLAGYTRLSQPR